MNQRAIAFASTGAFTALLLLVFGDTGPSGMHDSSGLLTIVAFTLLGAVYAGAIVVGGLLIASRRYAARGHMLLATGGGGIIPLLLMWWWAWT